MKKLLMSSALLVGVWAVVHAGLPLDQNSVNNQEAFWDTPLQAVSTGTVVLPVITKYSGGTTYSGRYCFTNLTIELTSASTFYLLDGGTTAYAIYGAGMATNPGIIQVNRERLGPLCTTAGNTATISVLPVNTLNDLVGYEGYSWFPAGNAAK